MESNHEKLRELFIAACDLGEEEQSQFIEEKCSEHPELRKELQRLLASDGETDGAFSDGETTSGVKFQIESVDEQPVAAEKSKFQFGAEIARGGMGAIVEGHDKELGRDLAIKVLLNEHKDNPQIVQRFLDEAQISSQLQHPGIAPIYEVGELDDSRPFISMKLIKGETLETLLSQRKNPGDERGKFLGIFEQVCQTLAYAHSRGVIHRDLKPANIMVGAFGEVQVMDWGLAKVLYPDDLIDDGHPNASQASSTAQPSLELQDRPVVTRRNDGRESNPVGSPTETGSVMGTPAYMSPEQALGQNDRLDQRSDVFSLGAILAEILTGEQIYVCQNGSQRLKMASSGDLDDCFQRLDTIEADKELVALTKKCLAFEPKDRPKDGTKLADRVTEYLESVARRLQETKIESAAQTARANEERKRRRVTVAFAATVLLATVLLAIGWSVFQKQKANSLAAAVARTNDMINKARLHRNLADAAGSKTEPDLDLQVRELKQALAFAEDAEKQANVEEVGPQLRTTTQQLRSDLEEKTLLVQKFADRAAIEQTLEKDLERIRLTNGSGLSANEVLARNAANDRDIMVETRMYDLGNSSKLYTDAFANAGIDVRSFEIEKTVSMIKEFSNRESIVGALDNWLRIAPDNIDKVSEEEPLTHSQLLAIVDAVDDNQWRKELRAALAENDTDLLKKLASEGRIESQPNELVCWMAAALRRVDANVEAVEILKRAQQQSPDDFWLNYELGVTVKLLDGQENEALTYLRAALALRPKSVGALAELSRSLRFLGRYDEANSADDRALEIDPSFLYSYLNLGDTLYYQNQFEEAIVKYDQAISMAPDYPRAYVNKGICFARLNKNDEAIASFNKAIEVDSNYALAYGNLGDVLREQGDFAKAIIEYEKMIKLYPKKVSSYINIGVCYSGLKQPEKSLEAYRKAIEIDPLRAKSYSRFAQVLMQNGKTIEAIDEYRKAIELDPDYAYGHYVIGYIFDELKGEPAAAIDEYRKAIEITPEFSECYVNIGAILRKQGKTDEAIVEYQKAIEANSNVAAVANAYHNLGACYSEKQDWTKAVETYRTLLKLKPNWGPSRIKLGVALWNQGKHEEAIAEYQFVADAKPISKTTSEAHYYLGFSASEQGRADDAVVEFRKGIKIKPVYPLARASLGLELHKLGRLEEANKEYKWLQKWARKNDEVFQALAFNLITTQDDEGQYFGAVEGLDFAEKANELKPQNAKYQLILGMAQYRNEQWHEALESLESSVELFQKQEQTRFENLLFLAMTHWKLDDKEKARDYFSKAKELEGKNDLTDVQQAMLNEAKELIE